MRNRLLSSLAPADLDYVRAHLSEAELGLRSIIMRPGAPLDHVVFIEEGLASVVAIAGPDRIEVGIVGNEGLIGVPAVLGAGETPQEGFMQVAGSGYRMTVSALRHCMEARPAFAATLLRFINVQLIQLSQTALANGRYTVEQRLARWLLMAHDRLDRDDLNLTHEFLAIMLGVRRPGVTVALHVLEGVHAIRSRRGLVTISDREKLKSIAGAAYGAAESAYERTFGTAIALAA
jgi:CRP-like cAMP-binding protein